MVEATAPSAPKAKAGWAKRLFSWGLAIVALSFVAWVVPVRDRCEDLTGAKVVVVHDASSCTLKSAGGDVTLPIEDCQKLKCEPGLASTLASARVDVLLGLLALYFVSTVAWAARWRSLLTLAGIKVSLMETWQATLKAQAAGILLPGGIGGDALRIAFMVGKGARTSIVVASVMLDRVIGLVTVAGLAAAFGLALGGGSAVAAERVTVLAWILASIPVGFVLGLILLRSSFFAKSRLFDIAAPGIRGKIARTAEPILAYVGDPKAPRALFVALLLSLFVSAVQLAVVRGFVFAIGVEPLQEKWVYVGTAMAMIVGAVPALPGGWGSVDAAYIFFFGPELAGLSVSAALTVCLLYRLFWYVSGVVGAVLHFVSGAREKSPA